MSQPFEPKLVEIVSKPSIYIHDKPPACSACPYNSTGTGFCPDWSPPSPKIAFLLEAAGENEILDKEPLVGAAGHVFTRQFLHKLGYGRGDVMLCNTLRCHPPENFYPTGRLRKDAEAYCRQWDAHGGKTLLDPGLNDFCPDTFLITIHPSAVNRTWPLVRLVQEDVRKAFRFYERGKRVVVLMGEKAMTLVKPDLGGGLMRWRGHWGPLDWRKDVQERFTKPTMFS